MLNNLTTRKDIRSFSVSPENPTGEKRYLPLQDDISSVAYWYSDNLDDEYPTFPDKNSLEII